MLAWTIYLSFAGALTCVLCKQATHARFVAVGAALLCLVVAGWAAIQTPFAEPRTFIRLQWIPSLGSSYHLGADGISITLVLLTAIASLAGILFSWNIERRAPEFFAFYLSLIGAVYGVFLSFDLLLLFVFYELAIIPKYFLIAIWGSTRKEYGAMKLALYSFAGSAMVLGGIVMLFMMTGSKTMDLTVLVKSGLPRQTQLWMFPLVFVGFGVLAGLWPFHTWAPTGHVAAPTGASMLLAGVVMKLGAYCCLRVAMPLFPEGLSLWEGPVLGLQSWGEVFGFLAAAGIVAGALAALAQKDFKFVIGYSSVSHMGFVLLGMVTLEKTGMAGSVLQMFSHGIIAGLLFAVVGRMVYDRTHTRDFGELSGFRMSSALPFATWTFVLAAIAGMGMPGFSGFVAELHVLIGAWAAFPTLAVLGGAGVLISAAYSLRAIQKGFFQGESTGTLRKASLPGKERERHGEASLPPTTLPEKAGAILLAACTVAVGLWPDLLLRWITPALNSSYFERLMKGGTP